jgi:hypothetical protein
MKTAGEILSALFDQGFVKKAQGYSKLFDSWTDITEKNGIATAADYSRVKELDRGILLVEIDHPGWKQILQTKQSKLLYDFRYRFPDLDISGISFMLSRPTPQKEPPVAAAISCEEPSPPSPLPSLGLDAIKDEDLKHSLESLGKSINRNVC